MKLGTKEIPALRLGAAAVLKAYLGGSQVWPLGFDPASLFAQGEQGVWYDPSDFSTLFQDSAGTTPVTAVEQPVGLMLNKSKGVTLGSEMLVNGDFNDGATGWIVSGGWSIDAANMRAVGNSAGNSLRQNNITTPGKYYSVSFDYYVSNGYALRFQNIQGDYPAPQAIFVFPSMNSSGRASIIFLATGTDIYLEAHGAYFSGYVSRLSVKEEFGNHARQVTATSRPVLSARVNLLTKTEQFSDSVWAKNNLTITTNTTTSPDETASADKLLKSGSTTTTFTHMRQTVIWKGSVTYIAKIWMKKAELDYGYMRALSNNISGSEAYCIFDLANKTVSHQNGGVVGSIIQTSGDWCLCQMIWTSLATPSNNSFDIGFTASPSGIFSQTIANGFGIYIWGASIVTADQADLPYQRVNTATDYDTVGFPHYLRFDGVDDWLVTNTITPGTDKVQVFAGVRKMSDAALGTVVELSAEASLNNGAMQLQSRNSASYAIGTRGTAAGNLYSTNMVFVSPITTVICARFNNAGSSFTEQLQFRANGSDMALTNALLAGTTSAGNYLAYPLYIGRRKGGALPFNGHIYGLIVRFGANLPAATIENTEKYINTKTRAY